MKAAGSGNGDSRRHSPFGGDLRRRRVMRRKKKAATEFNRPLCVGVRCNTAMKGKKVNIWGHPDKMSASEGGGGHGKADVVREVA